jgi:hypothetical protein
MTAEQVNDVFFSYKNQPLWRLYQYRDKMITLGEDTNDIDFWIRRKENETTN